MTGFESENVKPGGIFFSFINLFGLSTRSSLKAISTQIRSSVGDLERKKGTSGALFESKWLPDSNTSRTKIVSELITCYYKYFEKKRILYRGEKPNFIPKNKIITQKEWRFHLNQLKRKNPILEAYEYLRILEESPGATYQDLADRFNISKARVSQMIALVKKLPHEIIDYLVNENGCEKQKYFTERKLRPITLINSDSRKIEIFKKMKDSSNLK